MHTGPEYFTSEQLAEHLNVSIKSVIKWREQRRIPGAVKCGRIWRFRKIDVERRLLSGVLLLDR